ncbi:uncharacterized protein BKA78DRAFT_296677 [Phyllosticta capitalensis]|uniref:uncharacterized protein n=1 Tax=Phyllosticta capitalensis TaxID=121624 RepID=UPI00312D988B
MSCDGRLIVRATFPRIYLRLFGPEDCVRDPYSTVATELPCAKAKKVAPNLDNRQLLKPTKSKQLHTYPELPNTNHHLEKHGFGSRSSWSVQLPSCKKSSTSRQARQQISPVNLLRKRNSAHAFLTLARSHTLPAVKRGKAHSAHMLETALKPECGDTP